MEAESRKRGREKETTETLESERGAKKVEKDGYYRGGREEEEEEEEEREMGVFEFPWQKGREGVMTEEEWKEAGVVLGETFLGTLGREREREREEEVEVEIGGGMRWWRMEDMTTSTSSSSCCLSLGEEGVSLNLEEWWEDRDSIWAGHPSSIRHAHNT